MMIFDDDLKFMMNSRNLRKTKFKIVKVMNGTSKTISSHLILSATSNDDF